MKFLHTADWHIGRKLNGFSLLEEQQDIFEKVMTIAKKEKVDAIVIAGDLYDRSVPSIEAVALFNQMMIRMNIREKFPVLAISGNHDSSTRLETGSPWLKEQGFHLHTHLEQAFDPIVIQNVQYYLLPYFEPFHARQVFQDDSIRDIQTSIKFVVEKMKESFEPNKKQVLVGHFFAAGSSRSDSETPIEVGGLDSVPLDLLSDFDYVALGHLHDKNAIKHNERIQYSGALLKYSLSEEKQEKGVRIIELDDNIFANRFVSIEPLREVRQIKASFKELISADFYDNINREDYLAITLTDTSVIVNALSDLRQVYPRLISLDREALTKTHQPEEKQKENDMLSLAPEKLLKKYYQEVMGKELTKQQTSWLSEAIVDIRQEK